MNQQTVMPTSLVKWHFTESRTRTAVFVTAFLTSYSFYRFENLILSSFSYVIQVFGTKKNLLKLNKTSSWVIQFELREGREIQQTIDETDILNLDYLRFHPARETLTLLTTNQFSWWCIFQLVTSIDRRDLTIWPH